MKMLLFIIVGFSLLAVFADDITGVPTPVIQNAIKNNAWNVMLFGNATEKHNYAKGKPTQYGHLDFDADAYLRTFKGWSEKKVHDIGHLFGFSELRE